MIKKKFKISKALLNSPTRVLTIGFSLLIFSGAILLALPISSNGESVKLINALFTSTSASCVTGLSVIDIGTKFNLFGQFILVILMQLGGIGIMTFSTILILAVGRRPSFVGRVVIKDTFTHSGQQNPISILKDVVLFTLAFEGIGAFIMFFQFAETFNFFESLKYSIFHSVSAFCNAGFSLFSDNFCRYRDNWTLNFTISGLIIFGGIGFLTLSELKRKFPYNYKRWTRLSLHSKLVLTTTALLLIVGTIVVMLMESDGAFANYSLKSKFLTSFFQATSARTAGFNTINIDSFANETLFFLIMLMFIGACPGSCGGGIKTTTFTTLSILGLSKLRGYEKPQIFNRTIPKISVEKAINVLIISIFIICIGVMILQISEIGQLTHIESRGKFLELLFETVSAFGTVGLSTGITGELTNAGKLVIIFIMFAGRVGPLVMVGAIMQQKTKQFYFAEENIMIG